VRKALMLLSTMALAVLMVSGVALAVDKTCQADTDCLGTAQADNLTGSSGNDRILGLGGPDVILGKGGEDDLSGGGGGDEVRGGGGADNIQGGGGVDHLFGGKGNEKAIDGGPGIIGGPGPDSLNGGGGDDFILAANDGSSDNISCGASSGQGGDIVAFDQDNGGITDILDQSCNNAQQVPIGAG
jgi:Ca2+-binding RTX toxin-like protein